MNNVGADGLLRCKVCGDKLETRVEFQGKTRIVKCICSCIEKEREKWEKKHVVIPDEKICGEMVITMVN